MFNLRGINTWTNKNQNTTQSEQVENDNRTNMTTHSTSPGLIHTYYNFVSFCKFFYCLYHIISI